MGLLLPLNELILSFFSLCFNKVNINRYNLHRQKLFEVLDNFYEHQGVLRSKHLRTAY